MLWPFVSLLLTLPIVAFVYHRNHRLSFTSAFSAYVAVLYALGLVAFTMYPMPDDPTLFCATHNLAPQLDILRFIQDAQTGLYGVLQLVMNVVLFMPLGFMLCRWAGWKFWVTSAFALGCSIFIETSQLTGIWGIYPCAYRQFDVDDMLTNTLGAMLGYACAVLYTKLVPKKAKQLTGTNMRPGFVHRMVSMCIDFLLIALVYMPLSILYIFLFYLVFKSTGDGHYVWLSLTVEPRVLDYMTWITAALSFLLFEVWIPWRHHGQTLGCRYTHMTIETVIARAASALCSTRSARCSSASYSAVSPRTTRSGDGRCSRCSSSGLSRSACRGISCRGPIHRCHLLRHSRRPSLQPRRFRARLTRRLPHLPPLRTDVADCVHSKGA